MDWKTLKEFGEWYWMLENRPKLELPQASVKMCQSSTEIVLYRSGQYQVELICLKAKTVVPRHRHPDVSTMDVHLTGTGLAVIAGRVMPQATFEGHPMSTSRRLVIPRNVEHWGESETDVVVVSLQKWYNGVPPTFVTDNWEGEEPWT